MAKIIRNIASVFGSVGCAFGGVYYTSDPIFDSIDKKVNSVFTRPFGYSEDKTGMREDRRNLSSDLKRAIKKAKKSTF